ncbi:MAG: glycosyltransferase family 2 protein [Desulfuromonadaceae bacterium]|nr:glycosyltransferase family 2 protein [Desulfuromonadaceae bacterium]
MDHSPLISILIPVYNREDLVGPCIKSACEQTVSDFEIVIVDNASTDGTLAVCRELAAQDQRIRVFSNDSNLGPVRNWHRCITEAKGVYGKLLFSDDLMAPDYLAKTIPFFKQDDVGFVFSSAVVGPVPFEGDAKYQFTGQTGIFDSNRFISMSLFNGDLPVSPGGALFRLRDLRDNLLLDIPSPTIKDFSRHGAGPDLLIYLLTAARYPLIAYVHEPLSYFRAHEGSITVSKEKCDLNQCYRQARLWFAERYLGREWLKRLYVYEWKRECKETGSWTLPGSIVSRYSEKVLVLSPFDIASGLIAARSVKKGRLTLERGQAKEVNLIGK